MGGQEGGKKGKTRQREKKERTGKKHSNVSITTVYKVEGGNLARKKNPCPRCGDGTYLAAHKNRDYCGRCGYTVFHKKETEHPKQHEHKTEHPKGEAETHAK